MFQLRLHILQSLHVQSVINGHRNLIRDQRQKAAILLGIGIGMVAAYRERAQPTVRRRQRECNVRADTIFLENAVQPREASSLSTSGMSSTFWRS